jgi:hypothetical protein
MAANSTDWSANASAPGSERIQLAVGRSLWPFRFVLVVLAICIVWAREFGPQLLTTLLPLLTAVLAFVRAAVEGRPEAPVETFPKKWRRAFVVSLIATALVCGSLLWREGFFWIPTARMDLSNSVTLFQDLRVRWWNLDDGEQIHVAVRHANATGGFLQECRGQGRSGSMFCQIEVGGENEAGQQFEVIVFHTPKSSNLPVSAIPGPIHLDSLAAVHDILESRVVVRDP